MKKIYKYCLFLISVIVSSNLMAQEAVDLGLSVKWLDRNLGASSVWDEGNYYAWGETKTKSTYTWREYDGKPTYLNSISRSIYDASAKKGWRMPTKKEWEELITKCDVEYFASGREKPSYFRIIGPNGNSIILPHSTYKSDEKGIRSESFAFTYEDFYYWTCENHFAGKAYTALPYKRSMFSKEVSIVFPPRAYYVGLPIRAVEDFPGAIKKRKIEELDKRAECGNFSEMMEVAMIYEKGEDDVDKDLSKAFRLYKKLSDEHYAPAIVKLANIYIEGNLVYKNVPFAIELYSKLYDLAVLDRQGRENLFLYKNDVLNNNVLIELLSRDYVPYCSDADEKWNALTCEAAAVKGNTKAMKELVERYSTGNGVEKDETKSLTLLRKLAEMGDSDAMLELGKKLLDNSRPERYNATEGIDWYLKSAARGNVNAKLELIYFFNNGIHVKRDKKFAKKLSKELEKNN